MKMPLIQGKKCVKSPSNWILRWFGKEGVIVWQHSNGSTTTIPQCIPAKTCQEFDS
ncbi:hypothetical protein [Methanosarcina siciliae]|uniref:hypothetical protein n=1 Tax=Methanosarcina siciliae TaxID=38027 RepID=UPI001E5E8C4D|nr:hypothetical protein [Methanosarcina siciliae]